MSEYDGEARPLHWPLTNPLVYSRTTEDDAEPPASSFVWPEDSDERVPVLFNLSLNEFVVLASTIDVGSDIAYGIDAIRVWWLWDRMMRQNVSICAAIIDCILNDTDVRDTLRDFIIEQIETDDTTQEAIVAIIIDNPDVWNMIADIASHNSLAPAALQTNLLKDGECGLGYLYSEAITAVETLHTLSVNVFNNVSTGVSAAEYASLFTLIFPLTMNAFGASFVLSLASAVVGAIQTAYTAAWTSPLPEQLHCALFCAIQDDCEMSIDDLVAFYIHRGGITLSGDVYQDFLDILYMLQNGSITGVRVVYTMHLLMLTAMRLDITVLGIDFGQYAITITAAGDTEDNSYLTDCNDCPAFIDLQKATPGGGGNWDNEYLQFEGFDGLREVYLVSSTFNNFQWSGVFLSGNAVSFTIDAFENVSGIVDSWEINGAGVGTTPPDNVAGTSFAFYSNVEAGDSYVRVWLLPV